MCICLSANVIFLHNVCIRLNGLIKSIHFSLYIFFFFCALRVSFIYTLFTQFAVQWPLHVQSGFTWGLQKIRIKAERESALYDIYIYICRSANGLAIKMKYEQSFCLKHVYVTGCKFFFSFCFSIKSAYTSNMYMPYF